MSRGKKGIKETKVLRMDNNYQMELNEQQTMSDAGIDNHREQWMNLMKPKYFLFHQIL